MHDTRDRTTHAILADGAQVVRYDRASHWYVERSDGRRKVSIKEAAALATGPGATVRDRLPGGSRFRGLVRKINDGKATS